FIGEELLGVLDVQQTNVGYFDRNELRTLTVIANQLAIALYNLRQTEAARTAQARLHALVDNIPSIRVFAINTQGEVLFRAEQSGPDQERIEALLLTAYRDDTVLVEHLQSAMKGETRAY